MNRTLLLALVFVACGSDAGVGPNPEEIVFAAELEIDLATMTRTASGLYFQDVVVGDGLTAAAGTTVVVDYSGWLPNGTLFDSGSNAAFPVGTGGLIAGFDEGVQGMRVGGTRKLVIPPELGYGASSIGSIPTNSTLVFRITLKDVQ